MDLSALCDGQCPVNKVVDYSIHMVSGLSYMHMMKFLHLDIKPQNVLVADGKAKIGDFGLTTRMLPNMRKYTLGGTPYYLPYDTWNKKVYLGIRNDIWGLGCTVLLS